LCLFSQAEGKEKDMNQLMENLSIASTTIRALAVSAGSLIGVFLTLGFFFFMIWGADRLGGKK
jgi:hypothetical protein